MAAQEAPNFAYSSAYGLFEKEIVDTGTVETRFTPYPPATQIQNEGPIEFFVSILNYGVLS